MHYRFLEICNCMITAPERNSSYIASVQYERQYSYTHVQQNQVAASKQSHTVNYYGWYKKQVMYSAFRNRNDTSYHDNILPQTMCELQVHSGIADCRVL